VLLSPKRENYEFCCNYEISIVIIYMVITVHIFGIIIK